MFDINIKNNIHSDIENIQKDINSIETILIDVFDAMKTLDETKWKAKEKERVDQEFIPYLEKLSTKYPKELNKHLNYLRSAVGAYETHDDVSTKKIEEVSESINLNNLNSSSNSSLETKSVDTLENNSIDIMEEL